jgi:hypothetical protein
MISYLINSTAIWLLCLLVFELLLKQNHRHGWNRAWLLGTFAAGALIPLVQLSFGHFKPDAATQYGQALGNAANVAQIGLKAPVKGWEPADVLIVVYCFGAMIMLMLLVNEVMRLLWFQQYGQRKDTEGVPVIETQLNHPPFSFFKNIFISKAENYSPAELHFIVVHEKVHSDLRHSWDRLFMQLMKVVFWFNPLVWRYQKLLSLVHEYQADAVAGHGHTSAYGHFIVEQAMLKGAPQISNPFNYSPIKNRISMMTKQQGSGRQAWKYALVLPVMICSLLFFSQTSFSGEIKRDGKFIYVNGNKLEMQYDKLMADTIIMIDPVSGQEKTIVSRINQRVMNLNGKKVYQPEEQETAPAPAGYDENNLKDYLTTRVQTDFADLPSGTYWINMGLLVLDAKGKVIFVDEVSVVPADEAMANAPAMKTRMKDVSSKLAVIIMNMKTWNPGKADGRAVPCQLDPVSFKMQK